MVVLQQNPARSYRKENEAQHSQILGTSYTRPHCMTEIKFCMVIKLLEQKWDNFTGWTMRPQPGHFVNQMLTRGLFQVAKLLVFVGFTLNSDSRAAAAFILIHLL